MPIVVARGGFPSSSSTATDSVSMLMRPHFSRDTFPSFLPGSTEAPEQTRAHAFSSHIASRTWRLQRLQQLILGSLVSQGASSCMTPS